MRESEIEKHFIDRVKERGGEVRKVKWIGRAHAPDRLAMIPILHTQGRHFFVELKATGEIPSDGQFREHRRMRAAGIEVRVFNSISIIDRFFKLHDQGYWSRP